MQKNVGLAVALSVGLFYLWMFSMRPSPPTTVHSPGTPSVSTGTPSAATGTQTPPVQPEGGQPPAPKPGGRPVATTYPDAPDETISNGRLELTFAVKGGALKAAEAFGCLHHEPGDRSVPGDPGRTTDWVEGIPGALAIDVLGGLVETPDLTKSNWGLTKDADTVTAVFNNGDFVVTKTVRISKDTGAPCHADVTVSVRNVSAEAGAIRTLEIVGPVQTRTTPMDRDPGVLIVQGGELEVLSAASVHKLLAESPRVERRATAGTWSWIGARADFYLGALIPSSPLPADATVGFRAGKRPGEHGGPETPTAAATFRLPLTMPPPGETTSWSFRYFGGPNRRALLEDPASPYHPLVRATDTGGFLGIKLTWISDLMGWLLGVLASTGMGYGLAVLALTVIVRGALFPLSRKSQISMRLHSQKMQRLKPKMDAIKEKHKDPKKQQELTMKLMREEKVTLLPGGCLLAFAQMPIWIALYGVLQTTFEMRHASFLWVKDLTGPDHLVHLPFFAGVWLLPEWLNLLPILMMATWYTSAAMQPLPDDPQQASTAKMMRWMPVLMGLMLYSYASGLTLYMTMSALWSIGETWYIRKRWLSKLELALAK